MAALVIIIGIDLVIVVAVLIYGTRHDNHPVSVEAPSIKALMALGKPSAAGESGDQPTASKQTTEAK